MTLISEVKLDYNEVGVTEAQKFPSLTTGAISIPLQTDDDIYTAIITYNASTKWLSLKVTTMNGDILQGETFLADFPTNLLNCEALRDFGLFYFPHANTLKYVKLDEDWYNSINLDYETLLKCLTLNIFPSEIIDK